MIKKPRPKSGKTGGSTILVTLWNEGYHSLVIDVIVVTFRISMALLLELQKKRNSCEFLCNDQNHHIRPRQIFNQNEKL